MDAEGEADEGCEDDSEREAELVGVEIAFWHVEGSDSTCWGEKKRAGEYVLRKAVEQCEAER